MLKEYKRKTNLFIGFGLLVWTVGNWFRATSDASSLKLIVGYGVVLVGVSIFIIGCSYYAKAKGHSRYLGLLGLLYVIGLIVLALLPDKHKNNSKNGLSQFEKTSTEAPRPILYTEDQPQNQNTQ